MKQICNKIQLFGVRGLLLAVMIFAGQNAWGQETVFEYDGRTNTDATVGSFIFNEKSTVVIATTSLQNYNANNTTPTSYLTFPNGWGTANNYYATIKPNEGSFKAGDTLRVQGYYNNSSMGKSAALNVHTDANTKIWESGDFTDGRNVEGEPSLLEYILEADADSLILSRANGSASVTRGNVLTLKVIRPSSSPIPDPDPTPDPDPDPSINFTSDPANNSNVGSFSQIMLTFLNAGSATIQEGVGTLDDVVKDQKENPVCSASLSQEGCNSSQINIQMVDKNGNSFTVQEQDTYTITIAAGAILLDGVETTLDLVVTLIVEAAAPGDGEEYGSGSGSGALVLGEDMTEQTLAGYVGKTQDAHLLRTFYKDGSINTICLPFSLTEEQLAESPLKGYAKLQRVSSASVKDAGYDSQSLDLTLTDVTSIEAGAPYIISWTEGEDGEDIVDPLFENVTITTASPAQTAPTGGVAFRGTFTPKSVTAGDKGVMFVGSDGQISWPETDDVIKGFRCWFSIDK